MICKISDGSTGSGTCPGVYRDTTSVFGGTPTPQTVSALLTYAASSSNVGGTAWYGQVKATQELAKERSTRSTTRRCSLRSQGHARRAGPAGRSAEGPAVVRHPPAG
jgi:hypothetical protein